jgi:gas vesicle protein
VFGAVAGAASFFFLKTEEGKKARKRLSEEWEKAKEELANSGALKDVTKSLPETFQHTIEHIIEPKRMIKTTTIKRVPPKKLPAPVKKKEVKPKKV